MTSASGVAAARPSSQTERGGSIPTQALQTKLHVVSVTLEEANRFILAFHRHHLDLMAGLNRMALAACEPSGFVHGVAVLGQPVALNRMANKSTLEVSRVATDGHPNACSVLYAACARSAKALGYQTIITYVLDSENGTSLRAAGWTRDEGYYGGIGWANRPGRRDAHPIGPKGRWRLDLRAGREVIWPVECEPQPDPQLTLLASNQERQP